MPTLLAALLLAAPADRLLGLNLAGLADWTTELVFNDAFKLSREWVSHAEGKPWGQGGPLDLDARGHVKSLKPGQSAEALLFTGQEGHYPAGDYVCTWEGRGELTFGLAARLKHKQLHSAVVTVNPKGGGVAIKLTRTDPADPVRDIRFYLPGTARTAEAEPFHESLLARLKGFRVIRFMDWGSTNGNPVVTWADRTTPAHSTQTGAKGCAVEYMLKLAAATKCDPWLCVPHMADDNYVTELGKLVKAMLPADRRVYLEYSNETWNGAFEQGRYCAQQGRGLGLSDNDYEAGLRFSAQRSVEVFKLFTAAVGDPKRVVRVLASQAASAFAQKTTLDWKDAHKHADAFALAPYFGGGASPADAPKWLVKGEDGVLADCRAQIDGYPTTFRGFAAEARKRNLRLMAYEGGQHLLGPPDDDKLTALLGAANLNPKMEGLYTDYLNGWFGAGGDLFCVFSSVGRNSKWGNWGLLEFWDQPDASSPKMRAVRALQK